MDSNGVLVIGSMNYDSFYSLPRTMRIGENLHAVHYQTACGGKGANQAVQCAKLGLPTTMFGCLGSDSYGDQILEGMTNYGVDMRYVKRTNVPTGNASIWVYPDSEVQAAIFGGANMCVEKEDIDEILPLIKRSKIVILQNEIPIKTIEYCVKSSKESGCYLIYNAAPALDVSQDMMKRVDLFVVNEAEASYYSHTDIHDLDSAKQGVMRLASLLDGNLILTLGSLGSLVVCDHEIHHIPAEKVHAVETTGAGDSFVGALAYGILNDLSILEAARVATRASAITVSSVGAQPSMPTLEQLLAAEKRSDHFLGDDFNCLESF